MRRSLLPAVLSLSLLLSAVATTYAASYTFTTFAVPGARLTTANGMNTAGQVVGLFQDTQGANYGFLKDGETYTIINVPNAVFTEPRGINDNGQIVGTFSGPGGYQGFVATPVVVDKTPPVITVAASPATLAPPNGKRVTVTVSGMITDHEPGGSGVQVDSAAYVVMDEYGQIQPSGNRTLGADGSYAFTVALEASRRGNDQDGRHYTIAVSARDNLGNPGFKSTIVTVPHG